MSVPERPVFERSQARTLAARLGEPRRFLQVVAGARQVGKSTLVAQAVERLDVTSVFISADEPTIGDTAWLAAQWDRARVAAAARWRPRRRAGPRRGAEDPPLVGDGEAPLGRGHARPSSPQGRRCSARRRS